MKKLFLLLTAMLCVAMLSSSVFAADADAYALYQRCAKKMNSVSSVEISTAQKFTFAYDGKIIDAQSVQWNETTKILMTGGGKIQMESKSQVNSKMNGTETKATTYSYFKDGELYFQLVGEKLKIKYNPDIADMNDALERLLSSAINLDMDKDEFKDAKLERVSGGTKITLRRSSTSTGITSANYKIRTINVVSIIIGDDNILKSYSESATTIEASPDGRETYKTKTTRTHKVKSVNSFTKINFPSDLDTYKSV